MMTKNNENGSQRVARMNDEATIKTPMMRMIMTMMKMRIMIVVMMFTMTIMMITVTVRGCMSVALPIFTLFLLRNITLKVLDHAMKGRRTIIDGMASNVEAFSEWHGTLLLPENFSLGHHYNEKKT